MFKRIMSSVRKKLSLPRNVLIVIAAGIVVRILFWLILSPVWKNYYALVSTDYSFLGYCGDFIGYAAWRPPFYDFIAGRIYMVTEPLLGANGLTFFSLLCGIGALPFAYLFPRDIFGKKAAFFSLVLFAFYPKLIFITARGMPEAVSLSFVVVSLYLLAKAFNKNSFSYFFFAGLFATVAYLMFIPALLFLALGGIFILFKLRENLVSCLKSFFSYVSTGIIAGVPHFLSGALTGAYFGNPVFGGEARQSIFVNPSSYSVLEKAARYIGYTFFDFWWHTRGGDTESQVFTRLDLLNKHLPFFQVSFSIWVIISIFLTLVLIFSIKWIYENRPISGWTKFILVTAVLYGGVFWFKVVYLKDLKTTHVLPMFAFLSVLFGIGVVAFKSCLRGNYLSRIRPLVSKFVYLSLASLIVVSLGHAVVQHNRQEVRYKKPFRTLGDEFSEAKIGVLGEGGDFKHTLMIQGDLDVRVIIKSEPQYQYNRYTKYSSFPNLSVDNLRSAGFEYILVTDSTNSSQEEVEEFLHSLENCPDLERVYFKSWKGAYSKVFRLKN